MPSSRMPKPMAEKKEVAQWIEEYGGVPTPAAVYFKNERGWKISEAQVRYWWKQRTAINAAPALRSRLNGAGAKPWLSEIEDIKCCFVGLQKRKSLVIGFATLGSGLPHLI
ncbi:hypothetical protein GN244_ATG14956 [Phytophthora infestans]|uniref:HTH CENPB-type domain-containing protein n=1 Tax=Phytophthora infestans TaxID=4787 RepID=A0A833RTR4_PHYIN|nr:hypothetical protein GN244_ATG14956 [Phytophthora infestans]